MSPTKPGRHSRWWSSASGEICRSGALKPLRAAKPSKWYGIPGWPGNSVFRRVPENLDGYITKSGTAGRAAPAGRVPREEKSGLLGPKKVIVHTPTPRSGGPAPAGVQPSSVTGKTRNPLASGRLFGVRQTIAPPTIHALEAETLLLPELSPTNGVPTPRAAGFLETDLSSGRDLESCMMRFRNGPEIDQTKTPPNTPDRSAPAGTSQCRQYIRFSCWRELCGPSLLSAPSTSGGFGNLKAIVWRERSFPEPKFSTGAGEVHGFGITAWA
jgi:hypothetical protein